MKLWYRCVFLCSISWVCLADRKTLRFCAPDNVAYGTGSQDRACSKFNQEQKDMQCVSASNRLECFTMLADGKADFMVGEPEDLALMKAMNKPDIVVTHQLKKFDKSPAEDVEMIVLVGKNPHESFSTKGHKLCYIGLESHGSMKFNFYYTNYFENWLVPQDCDPEKPILENRLASLSKYFESACVAGSWSLDPEMDRELKSKYSNLCALCRNPKKCDNRDLFYGMNGALSCLEHRVGDIAWINKVEAKDHLPDMVAHGYHFLCPDLHTVKMTDENVHDMCTWIVDPRPVILANKDVAHVVREKVTDTGMEGINFYSVIHTSYEFSHLSKLNTSQNVADYLERYPRYGQALSKLHASSCRKKRSFSWCVSTDLEERKCRSLQKVADINGIRPVFTCVKMPSRDECAKAVVSGKCDVFVAQPDEVVKAKKLGAKAIIDLMAYTNDDSNSVAAIVKKTSKYNSLLDLKGARACFTGRKSVGWNSFLSALQSQSYSMDCSDLHTVSNFFNDSCVLGLDDRAPKNLRSLCHKIDTKLEPDEKTFQCLMNDVADVAFVGVMSAWTHASQNKIFNAEYKLLCPSINTTGTCYLGKMSLGSIIASEKMTKVMEDDIYLAFLKMDSFFGRTYGRETSLFEMYDEYEDVYNVIFPNATMRLERAMHGGYGEDLNFSSVCSSSSASDRARFELSIVVLSVLFHLILTCLMLM